MAEKCVEESHFFDISPEVSFTLLAVLNGSVHGF